MAINAIGWIKQKMHTFGAQVQIPGRFLNRLQEDHALLSKALTENHQDLHLPQIQATDFLMDYTAGADKVTLEAGVFFTVGGVRFSTDDLASREFTIPDNTTRYLYLEVATDCGDVVDYDDDPIERTITPVGSLSATEEDSTSTKMKVLKAVKAGAGETPTITAYENNGHSHVSPELTAANVSYDDTATKTNAGNVQVGLDHLQTIYTDTGAADALVITPSPPITAYAAGQVFRVAVANDTTGACTININSKGAKSIKTADGNDPTPKALRTGAVATLIYDGTNFQLVGSEAPQIIEITPTAVLTGGQADTFTAVDCSPAVPAGTRFVIARLNSSSTHYAQVRRTGSSTQWGMLPNPNYAGDEGTPITIPVDSSRQFDYRRGGNPGTSSISIDIVGYYK